MHYGTNVRHTYDLKSMGLGKIPFHYKMAVARSDITSHFAPFQHSMRTAIFLLLFFFYTCVFLIPVASFFGRLLTEPWSHSTPGRFGSLLAASSSCSRWSIAAPPAPPTTKALPRPVLQIEGPYQPTIRRSPPLGPY